MSRIDGHVVDASGAAVSGVTVTMSDGLGATVRRATTDASGAFVIADLPPGRYRLAVAGTAGSLRPTTAAVTGRRRPARHRHAAPAAGLPRRRGGRGRPSRGVDRHPHLARRGIDRPDATADRRAPAAGRRRHAARLGHRGQRPAAQPRRRRRLPLRRRWCPGLRAARSDLGPGAGRVDDRRADRGHRLRAARVRLQGRRRHRRADPRRGGELARLRRDRGGQRIRGRRRRIGGRRDRARRDAVAAGERPAIRPLPRSGPSRQLPQPGRQPDDGGAAHRRQRRARSPAGELGRRRGPLRRPEHRRAGRSRTGGAPAARAGRGHGLVAARLVGIDRVAGRRLRPARPRPARSERVRHAAVGRGRSAADARRRAGRGDPPGRPPRGEGRRRVADAAPVGALRVCRHRRGGSRGSRLERGGDRVRPRLAVPFRGPRPAVAVLGLRAGHVAGDPGADVGRRPALRSHDAAAAATAVEPAPRRGLRGVAAHDACAPRSAASTSRRSPNTCCSPRHRRRGSCRRSSRRR